MGDVVLGIDLGTTNSAVAVAGAGGIRVLADADGEALIPSVVSFHPNGDVLVGREAKERRLVDARNTVYSTKRLIGRPYRSPEVRRAQERFPFELVEGPAGGVTVAVRGEQHTLSEISAFVLRKVRAIAEASLRQECDKAVVTVPANFNELQRSATKAAGKVAGIDIVRILNEPTAAALAYGYGKGSRERIAIFDLGGGTFDITILDLSGDVFEVMATAGDTFLGGDDIDLMIAEQMADAFLRHHRYDARTDPQAFERLRAASEWAKCELSEKNDTQLRVDDLAFGDGGKGLHLKFRLTRDTLEGMAQPLIARAFDVCEDAMKSAGIRPSQLDNVILVGGQTRMPLVKRMVADYFGMAPLVDHDPELVVARGAAVQAQVLAKGGNAGLPAVRVGIDRISVPPAVPPPSRTASSPPEGEDVDLHPLFSAEEVTAIDVGQQTSPDRPSLKMPIGSTTVKTGVVPPPPPAAARSIPPGLPLPSLAPNRPSAPPIPSHLPMPGARRSSAPPARPPLLLDVTPLTLGVETVEGFCEAVIPRNSAIPAEQSRTFTTAQDDQDTVRVRICQGESRRLEENQGLGEFLLSNLPKRPRGVLSIGVTFQLDADGTLNVSAKDLITGQAQRVQINLVGGLNEDEIRAMQARQSKMLRTS